MKIDTNKKKYMRYNPANTDELIGEVEESSLAEVDLAATSARQAFLKWKNKPSIERGEILRVAADLLEANMEELAILATKETGKVIRETRGEIGRAAAILRYYGQEGWRQIGEHIPSAFIGKTLYSSRVPIGPIAVISPWNFPIAIPIWKMAPALVFGNTVVWKPSEESTLTAIKLAEILWQAGLPKDVLQMVNGSGATIGEALVRHKEITAVTFTGSNQVGNQIAVTAASQQKKYQLELGGKNPAIVMADCDLSFAAQSCIDGAMKQSGQRCTATGIVYVEEAVYDSFKTILEDTINELKIGDPLSEMTDIGPVVSKRQYEKVQSYIQKGLGEGAELVCGRKSLADTYWQNGYYIQPTIFENVKENMRIVKEEIFGPVLCLRKVANYKEALEATNSSKYGLSASIFTNNLHQAFHFIQHAEAGMVQVNGETGGAEPQAPFGGMKASSSGSREQGQAAIEFFTEIKTVSIQTFETLDGN
ncbi:aldehyde dehydrogenase family protein [Cytobacillus sp. FSL M8-0252]|uniref:aldehyde dehydrogenase family protein n=1 Tax=Cytobacillus sp. FSL M8-0252 TaxID=2921621 RepID=UPI0030F663DB